MSNEPADTGPDSTNDRPAFTDYHIVVHGDYIPTELIEMGVVAAAAVYSKAFVEALARRHADGLADLVRTRYKRGKNGEAEIGPDGGQAATIIVSGDLSDEARLSLLDLDLTDDAVRGKPLRWDQETGAWRPGAGLEGLY